MGMQIHCLLTRFTSAGPLLTEDSIFYIEAAATLLVGSGHIHLAPSNKPWREVFLLLFCLLAQVV